MKTSTAWRVNSQDDKIRKKKKKRMKDWISISHKAHNKNQKYDVDEKHQG